MSADLCGRAADMPDRAVDLSRRAVEDSDGEQRSTSSYSDGSPTSQATHIDSEIARQWMIKFSIAAILSPQFGGQLSTPVTASQLPSASGVAITAAGSRQNNSVGYWRSLLCS